MGLDSGARGWFFTTIVTKGCRVRTHGVYGVRCTVYGGGCRIRRGTWAVDRPGRVAFCAWEAQAVPLMTAAGPAAGEVVAEAGAAGIAEVPGGAAAGGEAGPGPGAAEAAAAPTQGGGAAAGPYIFTSLDVYSLSPQVRAYDGAVCSHTRALAAVRFAGFHNGSALRRWGYGNDYGTVPVRNARRWEPGVKHKPRPAGMDLRIGRPPREQMFDSVSMMVRHVSTPRKTGGTTAVVLTRGPAVPSGSWPSFGSAGVRKERKR
jgi:hypothetical protein